MANGDDYLRGRNEAALEGRMSVLEARLEAQGSTLAVLTRSVDRLEQQVTALTTSMNARSEVDRALKEAAESVTKRAINRRDFWFGIAIVVLTLGLVVAGFLAAVQH